jgi:DNA (cytosine-5)-methyltransferase 1
MPVSERIGKRRISAVDLFCGCGGFSLGLIQAGIDVLLGLDNDVDALMTYCYNLGAPDVKWLGDMPKEKKIRQWSSFPPVRDDDVPWKRTVKVVMCKDIHEVFGWDIMEAIGVSRIDVVVGGPPCQSFSRLGKRKVGDPRDLLVFEFVRLVHEIDPLFSAMENVPAMTTKRLPNGSKVMDVAHKLLKEPFKCLTARDVLNLDRDKYDLILPDFVSSYRKHFGRQRSYHEGLPRVKEAVKHAERRKS